MNKVFGVKGFDKSMYCRKQQYEIGEVYEMPDKPKLCSKGFHYSENVKDCFSFYPNNGSNRFCLVEILGDVDKGVGKCATNKIKIIRELTQEEILSKPDVSAIKLKELNNMGYVIGGSMALKIHGYRIDRDISDIDLIIKENIPDKIEKDFYGYSSLKKFSGLDSIFGFVGLFGEKYDIIQSNTMAPVKRTYCGVELLIQDEHEIWLAKLKYALNGSLKHMKDITTNNIKFSVVSERSNDPYSEMPF